MLNGEFMKIAGLGAVSTLATGIMPVSTSAADENKSGKPPNFIVILIDDMGYADIEPFGSKLNRTPNLNRMAAEGMKLTSFYAASVCTPSRAQLMTGCYAKRVSMSGILFPVAKEGISHDEKTVADLLKAQGYSTMCIGKWHLGDQPEFLPTRYGFDHFIGLPYSNDMDGVLKKDPKYPALPLMNDEKVIEAPAEQNKLTALYTDEAVKFIKANKEKPFFLYFAHTAVHVPLHPGKAFEGKSKNGKYGDWVEEIDWGVGLLMDTLRELNLGNNTMVIFTSDNGPWLSKGRDGGVADPLRGGKGTCWEGGLRVPTIAWWPGKIPAGTTCDAITSEMDILPTLVGLAGGKVPDERKIDGKDIWPILYGKSKNSPYDAFYYFHGKDLQAVRSGKWKLLIRPQSDGRDHMDKSQPIPALFDLENDIGESKNLAAEFPEVVKQLQELVGKMDKDLGVKGATGPGVRPCGSVKDPKPLLKRSPIEYD